MNILRMVGFSVIAIGIGYGAKTLPNAPFSQNISVTILIIGGAFILSLRESWKDING